MPGGRSEGGGRAMAFSDVIDTTGKILDGAGVAITVLGILMAAAAAGMRALRRDPDNYRLVRRQVGRSILLGLELLVAADIVRTVAVTPTVTNIAVLGGIILIRTFLSFSLELEITGRWPWQQQRTTTTV
jgi:uncharacterized membrane protein